MRSLGRSGARRGHEAISFSRQDLAIDGVALIWPRRHADERGWSAEAWTRQAFSEIGIVADFVQDNESLSRRAGTVRGLHFQKPPFEQAKLVRVVCGRSWHAAVDLRPASKTFGQWCGRELSGEAGAQLFIARGFAHGFITLEADTMIAYKVDAPYMPSAEEGIQWEDPTIGIEWPAMAEPVVLSERDRGLPSFRAWCEAIAVHRVQPVVS